MVILLFQLLAIANSEKFAQQYSKLAKARLKILQNTKYLSPQKLPNILKILSEWQNFAQSGHTGEESEGVTYLKSFKHLQSLTQRRKQVLHTFLFSFLFNF